MRQNQGSILRSYESECRPEVLRCELIHYVALQRRQAGVTKGTVTSVSFKVSGRKRYRDTSILEYLEQCGGLLYVSELGYNCTPIILSAIPALSVRYVPPRSVAEAKSRIACSSRRRSEDASCTINAALKICLSFDPLEQCQLSDGS